MGTLHIPVDLPEIRAHTLALTFWQLLQIQILRPLELIESWIHFFKIHLYSKPISKTFSRSNAFSSPQNTALPTHVSCKQARELSNSPQLTGFIFT